MVNELLVNLVNSALGEGKIRSRGNRAYICPFHKQEIISEKLEINFDENSPNYQHWACWSCPKENKSKGKTILSLFKKKKVNTHYLESLYKIIPKNKKSQIIEIINNDTPVLPNEFTNFKFDNSNFLEKQALNYLYSRNITKEDIIKYNIGYCSYGKYQDRIIIPSYDSECNINFFSGRSYNKNITPKYKNSPTSKDIIMFESFINWDLPIILVEGVFDAIAVKRNVIPIMGKNIQNNLRKKLIQSRTNKIYIALDNDALDYSIDYCQEFINEGKKVFLINLEDKDPSIMGFENFTNLIQKAQPLTEYSLMELKLNMV